MSEDLTNEIQAINSIYGANTLRHPPTEESYILTLPSHTVSIRLTLPPTYPREPPSIAGVESTGANTRKGYGTHVLQVAQQILREVYVPGSVCLFDLIQELETKLAYGDERTGDKIPAAGHAAEVEAEAGGQKRCGHVLEGLSDGADVSGPRVERCVPEWYTSEPVMEKKSTFVARACRVRSPAMARRAMLLLLQEDRKVAKASHNITAYRIRDPGHADVAYQDCDDGGESAAGGRLLRLLQIMDVWDVVVVVSRWYGGVKLGPDRFRLINQVGREAVVRGGWTQGKGGKG